MQLDELLDIQQKQWSNGAPVSIENLLAEFPASPKNNDAVVDLIYAEVLLRESLGQQPVKYDYLDRFPECRELIERQFQLHSALSPAIAGSDKNPSLISTHAGGKTLKSTTQTQGSIPMDLPGFELQEQIGCGGSGVAWRATDTSLNRTVAIKFLHDTPDGSATERLVHEATSAAKLVHPFIVQIFQVGESLHAPFLVMEYVEGGSLAEKLRSGPFSTETSVAIASKIGQAIEHAHRKNVIHRDVKPGNILLQQDGTPQICDFGLARKLDTKESLHHTGDIIGTPAYMSPEQAKGEPADARSDIYSLGAVLYESLTGRSPFQAANPWEILYLVNSTDPVPLRQLNPALPIELETICQKCLEKQPNRRYQTAKELVEDLQRFATDKPILARPTSTLQKISKWCRRNRLVAGLGATSLLLLLVLATGSTIAAYKLSASNQQVLAEKKIANDANQQAILDRSVAVDSLNELVATIEEDLKNSSISLPVKRRLATKAIAGLRKISKIENDAEAMHASIVAKMQIAELQSQLGKQEDAINDAKEAVQDARAYITIHPDHDDQPILAKALQTLATLYSRNLLLGELKQANDEAIERLDQFLENEPNNLSLLRRKLHSINLDIDVLWPQKPSNEVATVAMKNVETGLRVYRLGDDDPEALATVSAFFGRLGRSCLESHDLSRAEKYMGISLDAINSAVAILPNASKYQSAAGIAERMLGTLKYRQIKLAKSQLHFDAARKTFQSLLKQDPTNTQHSQNLANVATMAIAPSSALGKFEQSKGLLDQSIQIYRKLLAKSPGNTVYRGQIANSLGQKLDIHLRTASWSQAESDARELVILLDGKEGETPIAGAFAPIFKLIAKITLDASTVQLGQSLETDNVDGEAGALFIIARQFALRSFNEPLDDIAIAQIALIDDQLRISTTHELVQHLHGLDGLHPMVKQLEMLNEARLYSLQASLLDKTNGAVDAARLVELTNQAIEPLKRFSQITPVARNMIYVEPDLKWLRQRPEFAAAGLAIDGINGNAPPPSP